MSQDQKSQSSGQDFSIPEPQQAAGQETTTATVILPPGERFEGTYEVVSNTATRDLLIGGGVLLVLAIILFFLRGTYANHLVSKRVPPSNANAAGWWLFLFLLSLAVAVVLAVVDSTRFFSLLITGPLGVCALISLIFMLVSSRK